MNLMKNFLNASICKLYGKTPAHDKTMVDKTPCSCVWCGWEGSAAEMKDDAGDEEHSYRWLESIMLPGVPMPAGSCPQCERPTKLGHLTDEDKEEIKARQAGKTTNASGVRIRNAVPPPPRRPVDNMVMESGPLDQWD